MDTRAAVVTAEALAVSFAELAVVISEGAEASGPWEADPLRRVVGGFLDGLAEISRLDAKSA
ncbi:endonuclease, partial [Pseudarthrobacter sp. MDT3-9]|nr:endonuclease [Pseudarthrobacter sp. MDT3-9]